MTMDLMFSITVWLNGNVMITQPALLLRTVFMITI